MPIGSAKIGVLGAGLVPGGSVTFNTTSTWTVPPGVKKVNITGVGGTGNPGNSGNAGNSGNIGTGGGGGSGGGTGSQEGGYGGFAYAGRCGDFSSTYKGGGSFPSNQNGNAGQTGNSGTAGSAGQAGQAGTSGNASSTLCKTFPGGAGGNAGNAGAAGNGGSGGNAGNGGAIVATCGGAGGNGGNGGGNGAPGAPRPVAPGGGPNQVIGTGGAGGGGAGATNDGYSFTTTSKPLCGSANIWYTTQGGRGGNTANYSVPLSAGPGSCQRNQYTAPCPSPSITFPTNSTGGVGSRGTANGLNQTTGTSTEGGSSSIGCKIPGAGSVNRLRNCIPCFQGPGVAIWSPYPSNSPAFPAIRSGGGGGGGAKQSGSQPSIGGGGGGGGGGRGNAGNAGGSGGAGGTGSAGTPSTFNCVAVTPGSSVPVTVGGPTGGQIVISWNPQ